jgi:hypothetical protein
VLEHRGGEVDGHARLRVLLDHLLVDDALLVHAPEPFLHAALDLGVAEHRADRVLQGLGPPPQHAGQHLLQARAGGAEQEEHEAEADQHLDRGE